MDQNRTLKTKIVINTELKRDDINSNILLLRKFHNEMIVIFQI